MKKKLAITVPILVTIIVSVVVTTVLLNNQKQATNPSLANTSEEQDLSEPKMENKMYIIINNQKLEIELEDNSTVSALMGILPLELSMSELNGNEKYVYLDKSLPTGTYSPKHIEAGDVMLYGDNCLVVFYKSFDTNYSYSKIGHIDNLPELGDGDISISLRGE